MKVAAAQASFAPGALAENLDKISLFAGRAREAGAELIVFPEMCDTGYSMAKIRQHATSWSGDGAVPQLQELARNLSIAIVCGVSERDGEAIYNSQVVLDRSGQIIAKYRKTHLFAPAPIAEHLCFSPGDCFSDFSIAPFRFGLSICYDLRFPEVYRTLAAVHHVNAFVISSAWPFPRGEHFRTLAAARAIENQCYVIAANQVGTSEGTTFCGTSAIIDPYGVVLAAASQDREELIQADLSNEVLQSVRDRLKVFEDRRADLYR
jgi:predicted amidohydrolase